MERKRVAGQFAKETAETKQRWAEEKKELKEKNSAAVGAPRVRNCRTFARSRMMEALPEIVKALAKEAKGGSVAHAKALAELSGLTKNEKVKPKAKRRGKSIAGRLLEEFGEE